MLVARRLSGVGLAILALQCVPAGQASAAPARWGGNWHLYEAIHVPAGLSWPSALLRAQARGCGWYLATITSAAENAFVRDLDAGRPGLLVEGRFGPWLGGFQESSRREPAGGWRWVTGEDFGYANWAGSEPDNDASAALRSLEPGVGRGTDETFLHIYSDGAWNDLSATSLPRGYVVEFDSHRRRRCRQRG